MTLPRAVVVPVKGTVLALTLVMLVASTLAQTRNNKPRVPPGVDPGGVTVAVVGHGIDYTQPKIAARLARDGEGEIIGWDYVDDDRRPFETCNMRIVAADHCNETPLSLLTSAKVRIVPLRAQLEKPQSLVEAAMRASRARAQIVFIGLPSAPPSRFIDDAAGFGTQQLYISAVVADQRTPTYQHAMGANFLITNAAAYGKSEVAAYLASMLIAAVDCAARGNMDPQQIRDCAVATPPAKK